MGYAVVMVSLGVVAIIQLAVGVYALRLHRRCRLPAGLLAAVGPAPVLAAAFGGWALRHLKRPTSFDALGEGLDLFFVQLDLTGASVALCGCLWLSLAACLLTTPGQE